MDSSGYVLLEPSLWKGNQAKQHQHTYTPGISGLTFLPPEQRQHEPEWHERYFGGE